MKVNTVVILRSQFSNMWEGKKLASLTYAAVYKGDDKKYQETYDKRLIDEVAQQADFWDCVNGFNESYSVEVKVIDQVSDKEKLEQHLTSLILIDMKEKTGKNPEDSFWDTMSDEHKKEIDEGVAFVRRNFPML